jgi:pyruvate formate lyase activating enzyme
VTEQAVLKDIKKDVLFYDQSGGGVTVSGGEPLMQPRFLQNLLQSCRDEGIHTAVDTCGYGPPEDMLVLAPHVDLFLYDLKVINDRNHLAMTGTSNALIHQNLEILVEEKRNIRIRYPVIPTYNDDTEDIDDLGEFLSSLKIMKITLLPYHTAGIHKTEQLLHHASPPCTIPLPSRESMEQISTTLIEYGLQVSVGG